VEGGWVKNRWMEKINESLKPIIGYNYPISRRDFCSTFQQFHAFVGSTQDLNMETDLEAVNGRQVRAIEVFAHALRFFREHALKVRRHRHHGPCSPEGPS